MSRVAWLLTALSGILLGVLWFFLLWSPTADRIEEVRAEASATQQQAQQQRQRAAELRQIRDQAPEAAADLATAAVLVPTDAALPSLLRQVQGAADDAGVRMESFAPGRPSEVADAPGNLASIQFSAVFEGNYFQVVDLIRRLEDHEITARGLRWRSAAIGIGDYPGLRLTLAGDAYARLAQPVADAPADEGAPEDTADDAGDEATPVPAPSSDDEELIQ